jgi:hypothetical protein
MYLIGFPLLLIPFAVYNIVAFLTPGIGWSEPLTRVGLPSGAEWTMSLGDMLVALAILLLLVEIIKAHRSGGRYLMDHLLSGLLLVAMSAEFYLVPRATTSTFFLLLVASLADVIGGVVALRRRPAVMASVPVVVPVEGVPAPLSPPSVSPASVSPPAPSAAAPSVSQPEPVAPPLRPSANVAIAPAPPVAPMPASPAAQSVSPDETRPDISDTSGPAPNPDRP